MASPAALLPWWRKWVSLGMALPYMLLCGALYGYSALSADMQAAGYRDISTIGAVGNVGTYCLAITAGLTLDAVGSRWLAVQSWVLMTLGWGFWVLALNGPSIGRTDGVAAMCFLLMGCGGIAGFLSCINSVEEQFAPRWRGALHGLFLAFYVMSSAVWASTYTALFAGQLSKFALAMTSLSAIVGAINVLAQVNHKVLQAAHHAGVNAAAKNADAAITDARSPEPTQPSPTETTTWHERPSYFPWLHAKTPAVATAAAATPAVALVSSTISSSGSLPPISARQAPPQATVDEEAPGSPGPPHSHYVPPMYPVYPKWEGKSFQGHQEHVMRHGAKDSMWRILTWRSHLSLFTYLMWIMLFVVHGTARIFTNSAGIAIKAMALFGSDAHATQVFVSNIIVIFASANFTGRFLGGVLNDALALRGISRMQLYTPASAFVLIAAFVLAFAPVSQAGVIVAAAFMGLGDGLGFATWPVIARETFGPARYGLFFSLMDAAVGFGSLSLNGLATTTYHASGTENPNGSWTCLGNVCFQQTWIIAGSLVAALGLVLAFIILQLVYWEGIIPSPVGLTASHASPDAAATGASSSAAASKLVLRGSPTGISSEESSEAAQSARNGEPIASARSGTLMVPHHQTTGTAGSDSVRVGDGEAATATAV